MVSQVLSDSYVSAYMLATLSERIEQHEARRKRLSARIHEAEAEHEETDTVKLELVKCTAAEQCLTDLLLDLKVCTGRFAKN